MSSIHRSPRTTAQGNDYFINVAAITAGTDTYTEAGVAAAVVGLSGSYAAGALLVKDMGKTVTVSGAQYRKVQAAMSAAENTAFYILLVPSSGSVCEWARMTLQA
jgi:hypothetical protein